MVEAAPWINRPRLTIVQPNEGDGMGWNDQTARAALRAMFDAAIASADPHQVLAAHLPERPAGRIVVVGAGKSAASMAAALEAAWPGVPLEGVVVTRYDHAVPTARIRVIESSHPVPDANSELGAHAIMAAVDGLGPDDLVIALMSGGASALIELPAPGLTLDDVVRAARLAGAEEFIERLPAGYDTFIEEGSANLSGGQRQRLAIARAVIANPKLMILDEATSALDPESEALVNANLTRLGKGRTMVIVSHRLSSLLDCDQILVMDRGTVIDMAPHRILLERCSIYRTLWAQQNRHMDGAHRGGNLVPVANQGD